MTLLDTQTQSQTQSQSQAAPSWVPVCRYADLLPERGVAALVRGVQIAIFRLHDGSVRAVSHHDPYSGANVMARGIVGTRGEEATVASPMYKQVFSLLTGQCLDDPHTRLTVFDVQVDGDTVLIDMLTDPLRDPVPAPESP
jgi:nitrite reductase (NADH) small subunit